ncbi:DUF7115 domain-containing protein [Halobellus salinus]|nr:hypothetical protein [Halobellus salinus]
MSQPEIVQSGLGDETVVAHVDLGGEDELYVTPTRTLRYRAEGLLSNESVEEFSHGAERVSVSEGRRKSKVTLGYGLDGEQTVSLPTSRLEHALEPIIEGVLKHNGVLGQDESVAQLFRFSELTVVVAGERVVRHIGPGLWDQEFESYHYSDVRDLEFEDGSVNTSVVLTVGGQRERFKTPNEDARAVRAALESTLLAYRQVDSIEELRAAGASEGSGDPGSPEEVSFGDGPDPLFADPTEPDERPDNAARAPDDEPPNVGSAPNGGTAGDRTAEADASSLGIDEAVQSGTAGAADAATPAGPEPDAAGVPEPKGGSESASTTAESSARGGGEAGDSAPGPADTQNGETTGESSNAGFEGSGFEAAAPAADEQVLEEVAALREVVEQQNTELRSQRDLIEQLIEELRRGR